jgi:hypothetical protein
MLTQDEVLEIIVVNAAADIHEHLEDQLRALGTDGWSRYSRPNRISHPRLQVKGGRIHLAVIDLGPNVPRVSVNELMRMAVLPKWFVQDIVARGGDDVLALVLTPARAAEPLAEVCKRVGGRRYKFIPVIRDPDYWTNAGITLGDEIERIWAERHDYDQGFGQLMDLWFFPN